MRTVKPGVTDGGMTQVEGINPGDVVANSSFDKLQDKSPCRSRTIPPSPANPAIEPITSIKSACPDHKRGAAPLESVTPFILRPVATSLLMAAILLVGIVSYTQLPVSALAASRLPDDSGCDVLSRRKSRR